MALKNVIIRKVQTRNCRSYIEVFFDGQDFTFINDRDLIDFLVDVLFLDPEEAFSIVDQLHQDSGIIDIKVAA